MNKWNCKIIQYLNGTKRDKRKHLSHLFRISCMKPLIYTVTRTKWPLKVPLHRFRVQIENNLSSEE